MYMAGLVVAIFVVSNNVLLVAGMSLLHEDDDEEPTEALQCCTVKVVSDLTYNLAGYNWTNAKLHDCKNGCIYRDTQGRETCFTHGKDEVMCHNTIIRGNLLSSYLTNLRRAGAGLNVNKRSVGAAAPTGRYRSGQRPLV
jgi:hypothetical protein